MTRTCVSSRHFVSVQTLKEKAPRTKDGSGAMGVTGIARIPLLPSMTNPRSTREGNVTPAPFVLGTNLCGESLSLHHASSPSGALDCGRGSRYCNNRGFDGELLGLLVETRAVLKRRAAVTV
jgi:hypothetical protein